jgi:hypothetical protein
MPFTAPPKVEPPIAIPPGRRIVPPPLRNPRDTRPEPEAVLFPPANDPRWWENRVFTYFNKYYAGNAYTQSAQLSIDANLNFTLFLYSNQTYGGGPCLQSVLDSLHGKLQLFTQPSLWLYFPLSTGDQKWEDTCNPALDHVDPLSGSWSYFATALDSAGIHFEFHNSNYDRDGWISDFVFHRIK